MAAELFNTLGGLSVGIPPIPVIDTNGNITSNRASVNYLTSNRLDISGNVTAAYFLGNVIGNVSGNFVVPGTNTSLIFNQVGNAGASDALKFNYSSNVLTLVGNLVATRVLTDNYLDSNGNPYNFEVAAAGSNQQIQFNSNGNLGADSNFYFDSTTELLVVPNISTDIIDVDQLNVDTINALGNINAPIFIGNLIGNVSNANIISANVLSGVLSSNSQPNITSVGTLTSLSVSGNANIAGTIAGPAIVLSSSVTTGNILVNGTANIQTANIVGNLQAGNTNAGNLLTANYITGTLTTNNQPNINYLGNLGWLNVNTSVGNSNGNITFNGSMSGVGSYSNINITGNLVAGNYISADELRGSLTVSSQPNITSLGNLVSLNVQGLANLGNVSNVRILGGNANYVLSTDGLGNLSWIEQTGGNGNGTPGGSTSQVQYNSNGAFAGDGSFTWNDSTKVLNIGNGLVVNNVVSALRFTSTVSTGTAPFIVTSTTPVANLGVDTSGTVRNSSQPNITSVGTLTSLVVSGNANVGNLGVGGSFSLSGNFSAGNISTPGQTNTTGLTVTGNATFTNNATVSSSGTLRINGNVNAGNSANVYLGNVSNVKIDGGINGYVLQTDGAGGLSWTAQTGGGGNGTPGGSNTQVQYNDTGAFGGSAFFTFNENTNTVTVAGNLIANSFQMGAGIYRFSYSNVYQTITNTSTPDQLIWSVQANTISGVDFVIVSTDSNANVRQVSKIFAVVLGSEVNYNETNTIAVNGYNGDFSIQYDPGNIIAQPTVGLYFSPVSGNTMIHKMQITTYDV